MVHAHAACGRGIGLQIAGRPVVAFDGIDGASPAGQHQTEQADAGIEVRDVGREIMKSVPGAVPEFEPFIRYHTFNQSSIDFTVILRAQTFVDNYLIKHEFIKAISRAFASVMPPEADPIQFAPRVRMPTLMIAGREDFVRPVERSQRPIFVLLGSPPEQKRLAVLDGGHLPARLTDVMREALAWLDRWLGPVR
mgnify:CR=1 FL=1